MARVTITARLRGQAAEPSGEPPATDPRASSVSVESVNDAGGDAGINRIAYENHAAFTGQTTFTERGTIVYDDGVGELDVETLGEGTLGPSADPAILHGAAVYRITAGRGRFEGAGGMITSNFLLWPERGEFEERQVAILFLP